MALFQDMFPWTNVHELNLDWILRQLRKLTTELDNFVALNTIKYADPIQWNITNQYPMNTVTVDPITGNAYLSVQPVPLGVPLTNTDYWTPIFTLNLLSANQNITLRDDGANIIATFPSNTDDWLIWNYTLYKVTQPIAVNEAYVVGYNLDRYSVEVFIKDYIQRLKNAIGDIDNLTTTDKTNLVNAINELVSDIGTLANLNTSDKSNLVNAINEVIPIETVSELIARDLVTNDNVETMGYYSAGDGGGAVYHVDNNAAGLGDVALNNGLIAHLVRSDSKLYNVKQYGAYGDGLHDDYTIIDNVLTAAITETDSTVYLPAGKYKIHTYLGAIRVPAATGVLKDLNNLTIMGDGDCSIIYGEDPSSIFDIIQLNQVKNITIKNLRLLEIGTPVDHGANGVSITNGGQNIILDHITVDTLPYFVGSGYIDGGKGFTLQCSVTPADSISNIIVRDCRVIDSPIGFECDIDGANPYPISNVVVDGCLFDVSYCGYIISTGTAYANQTAFQFINSLIKTKQRGIWAARACQMICNNISIEKEVSATPILASDTVEYPIEVFAISEACYFENINIRYNSGRFGVCFKSDLAGHPSNCVFKNITLAGSFTDYMFSIDNALGGGRPEAITFDNCLNFAAPTTYNANLMIGTYNNNFYGYGNYDCINKGRMTSGAANHTLGTYTGSSIPIYNTTGVILGYVPLYN